MYLFQLSKSYKKIESFKDSKMNQVLVIGDSHLSRINLNELPNTVQVHARPGLNARDVDFRKIREFKTSNVVFLIVGGNDIHFHPRKNINPATPKATADQLISCQFVLQSLFVCQKSKTILFIQTELVKKLIQNMKHLLYLNANVFHDKKLTTNQVCVGSANNKEKDASCLEFYHDLTPQESRS